VTAWLSSVMSGTSSQPVVCSHYIPAYAPLHPLDGTRERAVCGAYVDPGLHQAFHPTCPGCREALAYDAQQAALYSSAEATS